MQQNQDVSVISWNKRKEPNDAQQVVAKKIKNCREAIIPYYSKESISLIPVEIVKWILSFVTSPTDFVRLRTVCKQWNTILGELFFGTLEVKTKELRSIVEILQHTFQDVLPLMIYKDMLMLSAMTRYSDCGASMECPVKTTGIDERIYLFLMSTRTLLDGLTLSNQKHTLFHFSVLAKRITCRFPIEEGDRSIMSTLLEGVYDAAVHYTGFDSIDEWSPAYFPEHDLEVETIGGMFLGIYTQMECGSLMQFSIYMLDDSSLGIRILLVSVAPEKDDTAYEPALQFDYFFKERKSKDDQEVERWEPLWISELVAIEKKIGQRLVIKEDDLLFSKKYNIKSISDALRTLGPSAPITVCIAPNEENSLIIKYPGMLGRMYNFDMMWVVRDL